MLKDATAKIVFCTMERAKEVMADMYTNIPIIREEPNIFTVGNLSQQIRFPLE